MLGWLMALILLAAAVLDAPQTYFTHPPTPGQMTALPDDLGIVAARFTHMQRTSAATSDVVAVLPYGTELKIIGARSEWLHVRLPDQREGWLLADHVVTAAR